MRGAIRALLAILIPLAACNKSDPDFEFEMRSPDRNHVAVVRGFQPRGTVDGRFILSFSESEDKPAIFLKITNGVFGWASNNMFAVIGDDLVYRSLSSEYFPDGTIHSEINLVVCDRDNLDCSSIERALLSLRSARRISRFPEPSNTRFR